jgi:murein DD-endopeptidase MepM/ murein hydrolase activator NlpD
MKKLFKRLYELKFEKINLILWNSSDPDEPESYSLRPIHAIITFFGLIIGLSLAINAIVLLTPIRYTLVDYDQSFRSELMSISSRILELQDSLDVRDRQLANIKDVIRTTPDTIFSVNRLSETVIPVGESSVSNVPGITLRGGAVDNLALLRASDFSFDFRRIEEPLFPAPQPVMGIISAQHDPENGHFGIDIAANDGAPIRSIAAGVIINTDWSINFGYSIKVQHLDGFLSVYKHSSTPTKNVGDFINKGDILGSVSNTGVISTGPHLHFELWQNARPLNPMLYLIN